MTNDEDAPRKASFMDILLCRCVATEDPQGSMGSDGKFHLNLRNSNSTKFDQLEDSVHRLCNNKKKTTTQQKYVPRPAHPLLQKKDANGDASGDTTNGNKETSSSGYVPRAPHPILNKKENEANGDKEKETVETTPSKTESPQVAEETDASTQE